MAHNVLGTTLTVLHARSEAGISKRMVRETRGML